MPLAPVEFALFAFDDTRITGDIVPALTALVENELVHIIDLVFVRKEADGQVTAFELDDLPADAAAAFADLDHDIEGLVSTEDLDHEADLLEPGTSAIIVVWENLWAQRFTDAGARGRRRPRRQSAHPGRGCRGRTGRRARRPEPHLTTNRSTNRLPEEQL